MPRYRTVAVIGTGPSGISALRALHDEQTFDTIRAFDRRDGPGGMWNYDPIPQPFPGPDSLSSTSRPTPPTTLPGYTPPAPEDVTVRTALYPYLDSNVGADIMSYTHTPLPNTNSETSIQRYGPDNPTRPCTAITAYLKSLAQEFVDNPSLISFNTTVESVDKNPDTGKWTLTLRRPDPASHRDYWWQESFDAVIVASGHYHIPSVPAIAGLDSVAPSTLEHVKSFRSPDPYRNQKVLIVGGNYSAADLVIDLHDIVQRPLYVSRRGNTDIFPGVWRLPGVITTAPIAQMEPSPSSPDKINATFTDNTTATDIDKIIFATGYRLSYPFLHPNPVTPNNHLTGFYQHIFQTSDPSLAIVGQVRGSLPLRVYEYQAVAVARYFAGRNAVALPSDEDQRAWESERLRSTGASVLFHELGDGVQAYYEFCREMAGPPAEGTRAYELPRFGDDWVSLGLGVLRAKNEFWGAVARGGRVGEGRCG
ncbi:dimethylaniline monooxygenase [Aspergillus taichungensis]|uniref:Dimethylaniline monooxygenase n=1 Tax=Aspergillus taichungensis TaxID=482145 RepID=A0A2J5HVR1_9EURO|nr:dimethylaniline monooxygenase [Aspergillus taichungensis]